MALSMHTTYANGIPGHRQGQRVVYIAIFYASGMKILHSDLSIRRHQICYSLANNQGCFSYG